MFSGSKPINIKLLLFTVYYQDSTLLCAVCLVCVFFQQVEKDLKKTPNVTSLLLEAEVVII